MMHLTLIATVATVLVLAACGGTEQASAPGLAAVPTGAPAPAAPAPAALAGAASHTFFAVIPVAAGSADAPAAAATTAPPAVSTVEAARLLAWEQSYSLEMHRQHQEQLARADSNLQEGG